jgi:hypothetical protein
VRERPHPTTTTTRTWRRSPCCCLWNQQRVTRHTVWPKIVDQHCAVFRHCERMKQKINGNANLCTRPTHSPPTPTHPHTPTHTHTHTLLSRSATRRPFTRPHSQPASQPQLVQQCKCSNTVLTSVALVNQSLGHHCDTTPHNGRSPRGSSSSRARRR